MAGSNFWQAGLAPFILTLAAASAAMAQTETAKPAEAAAQKPAAKAPAPKAASPAKDAVKTVEAITVTGAAPDVQSSIDRKSYALGKDLQATTGSVADALRNVPSVEVDLQGNLSMRGDANVTILVDGKPSPAFEGAGRADALQQLPADQIERVEVITNPSAALNSEGTGGVINLITKKSRGGGLTGSAYVSASTAGLKRAGVNLGYNTKTLAVTAALSGNYQRNKVHNLDERDGLDPTSGQFLRNFDQGLGRNITRGPTARVNITFTPTNKDQLTGELSYAEQLVYGHPDDFYTNEGPTGAPVEIFDFHGHRRFLETANSASAGWKHTFTEGETLSVDGVYNATIDRDHFLDTTTFVLPVGQTAPLQFFRSDGNVHHAELRIAYGRNLAGGTLKTGYEVRREDNDYPYAIAEGPTENNLIIQPNFDNHYLFHQTVSALYATYQHGFGDLDVQGGLRLEDARFDLDQLTSGARDGQHYQRAFPTLHLGYKLDDDRKLSASYSIRIQRPPSILLNPLSIQDGPLDRQVGNPELKPRETRSYELGYEQHVGQQAYQATFYYRQGKNDFGQVITDEGQGSFLYSFSNIGRTQAVGADLTANGKFNAALSYSLGVSPYWNQLDAGPALSTVGTRSTFSAGGRANLNWQADPKDLLQLNAVATGARLQVQGVVEPVFTLNAGWRHTLTDRVTATLTAQDLLSSNRFHRNLDTPTLVEHLRVLPVSRAVLLRFDYRFGGGSSKSKTPDFDYGGGGGPG